MPIGYRLGLFLCCGMLMVGSLWLPERTAAIRQVLIYSYAGNLRLLDVDSGESTFLITYDPDACAPLWSLDGHIVLLFNELPTVLNVRTGEAATLRLPAEVDMRCNVLLSPDGSQVAMLTNRDELLEINFVGVEDGNIRQLLVEQRIFDAPAQPPGTHYGARWSPDGQRLAYPQCFDTAHCYYHFIAIDSGELLQRIPVNYSYNTAAWSPDGRWFIVGNDTDFILYDTQGEEQMHFSTPDLEWLVVRRASASADGRYIIGLHRRWRVSLYDDYTRYLGFQLYDTETQSLLQLPGGANSCCAAWSTTGAILAYSTAAGIRTYDVQTGTVRDFHTPIDPVPLLWWTTLE